MNSAVVSASGSPLWMVSPWNRNGIENSPMFTKAPIVSDCTLRDGEQQAGVVFNRQDKVHLARRLDAMGVRDLEVGTPAVSEEDRLAIEEIASLRLKATTSALARAMRQDIDLVKACGVDGVRISQPISPIQRDAKLHLDDEAYLKRALEIATYSKEKGLQVIFSPYDTTRCDPALLERLLVMFRREKCVDRVRIVDTTGAASPEAIQYLIRFMLEASGGIPIEVHCHNDFGLATANTIAGALAGAAYLSTTINGLGQRCGNASLEEVVMAMKVLYGIDLGIDTTALCALSADAEKRSGVLLAVNKPIVGSGAFAHETGMTVAGLLNNPFASESYAPELVGQTRSILVGKKSGRASIEYKLEQLGMSASKEAVSAILLEVKTRSSALKRVLTDDEFRSIARERVGN
jgi:isopropylmalate/homocitrate/citramalate synthase